MINESRPSLPPKSTAEPLRMRLLGCFLEELGNSELLCRDAASKEFLACSDVSSTRNASYASIMASCFLDSAMRAPLVFVAWMNSLLLTSRSVLGNSYKQLLINESSPWTGLR